MCRSHSNGRYFMTVCEFISRFRGIYCWRLQSEEGRQNHTNTAHWITAIYHAYGNNRLSDRPLYGLREHTYCRITQIKPKREGPLYLTVAKERIYNYCIGFSWKVSVYEIKLRFQWVNRPPVMLYSPSGHFKITVHYETVHYETKRVQERIIRCSVNVYSFIHGATNLYEFRPEQQLASIYEYFSPVLNFSN
jgi:hypothetical protein